MTSVRAVFMGSDSFSLPILRSMLEGGPEIGVDLVAVVSQPDRAAGRGRKLTPNVVTTFARESEISVLQPERLREASAVEAILALEPELLVVAAYGQFLPNQLLDAPRFGALNLHPSLLPRYRGPSPIAGAILAGDATTGTTLLKMTAKMDAGPILAQCETEIDPEETAGELEARLAGLSADLLMSTLPGWLDASVVPKEQDETAASYTRLFAKEDALIDWLKPAETIAREVRAFNPWPVAHTTWQGRQLRILRARAESGAAEPGRVAGLLDDGIAVGTGDGLLLARELQLAGGTALPALALARGRRDLLDAHLG